MLYQQGDVLFRLIANLPANAKELAPVKGKHIFAYGEATGHSHATLAADNVALYQLAHELFCRATSTFSVVHEEHHVLEVPPGIYSVRKVKEYDHFEEEARGVID